MGRTRLEHVLMSMTFFIPTAEEEMEAPYIYKIMVEATM
jgi:hypothetical protein